MLADIGQPLGLGRAGTLDDSFDGAFADAENQVLPFDAPGDHRRVALRLKAIPGNVGDLYLLNRETRLRLKLLQPCLELLYVVADPHQRAALDAGAGLRELDVGDKRGSRAGEQGLYPFDCLGRRCRRVGPLPAGRLLQRGRDAALDLGDHVLHFRLGQKLLGLVGAVRVRLGHPRPGDVEQTLLGRDVGHQGVFRCRGNPQR